METRGAVVTFQGSATFINICPAAGHTTTGLISYTESSRRSEKNTLLTDETIVEFSEGGLHVSCQRVASSKENQTNIVAAE